MGGAEGVSEWPSLRVEADTEKGRKFTVARRTGLRRIGNE